MSPNLHGTVERVFVSSGCGAGDTLVELETGFDDPDGVCGGGSDDSGEDAGSKPGCCAGGGGEVLFEEAFCVVVGVNVDCPGRW